jgi:ferrous iron transport protein B
MNLSELKTNEKGVIVKVKGRGAFRKRITEMGFVKGQIVTVIKNAPFKDPIEYGLMDYHVSLRRNEAELVEVVDESEAQKLLIENFHGITGDNILKHSVLEKGKTINIALVGNPNCGKTTFFNNSTGASEHVGNYAGVTVDAKKSIKKHKGYTFNITDLPGTYSLTAYTPEELYVRQHIFDEIPDIVVNVVDASNLERNLYLTTRLIDMDIKIVIALNMYDELEKRRDLFDYKTLAQMIGIPIVPIVATTGRGIDLLFDMLIEVYEDQNPIVRHIHINYGIILENAVKDIQNQILNIDQTGVTRRIAPRFLALCLLENDSEIKKMIAESNKLVLILDKVHKINEQIKKYLNEETETLITDGRYGFIRGALKENFKKGDIKIDERTYKIDKVLTHKYFGIPIFILLIWMMFQATFTLGSFPMTWIENGVSLLARYLDGNMLEGMLKDLIIDGIIGGVGGVIVYMPNILILFFIISFMEDTGYMSRAAFISDKVMHKIGLHGKSFIPLIMGFGCNVPAIMATRTLENKNDRLLTMLINPFMSCSARLPVYLVIIGAVFPEKAGTVLFLIYSAGIILSIIIAKVFKKVLFKSKEAPFVMELPPYRKPLIRISLKHTWNKGSQYLKKMAGVILLASILIWALGYFPLKNEKSDADEIKIKNLYQNYNGDTLNENYQSDLTKLKIEKNIALKEYSYIGRIGRFIEPAIRPLGFDWKIGVSIVTGIAAKEIVVSTMGVLYGAHFESEDSENALKIAIQNEVYQNGKQKGKPIFTPLVSVSFLAFILIYFPCIEVIAAVKKESGSWKPAAFLALYTTILAWFISFSIYQIGSIFL